MEENQNKQMRKRNEREQKKKIENGAQIWNASDDFSVSPNSKQCAPLKTTALTHTHTHTHTHFTHPTTYTWLHTDTHPSQPLRNRQRGVIRLHTQPLSPSPHTHWHTRLHTQAHTRLRPICLIGELHTQLHTRLHTQLHTWFRARQVIHWATHTHTHTHTHWHTRLHTLDMRMWDNNSNQLTRM